MARSTMVSVVLAISMALFGAKGSAQETFRITQVFSNLDGSIQFVELTESAGMNGQHRFAGLTLTSTHAGVVKRFSFSRDLPTAQTAHMTIVVSVSSLFGVRPESILDFIVALPMRFIPTDGGTLDFAGVDRVSYASLPTDGVNALYRNGSVSAASIPSNGLCYGALLCQPGHPDVGTIAFAVEYHDGRDHYFITASAPDIDALDSGRHAGWQRTGEGFTVSTSGASPVCRFYIPPGLGDSHFLSASPAECQQVRSRHLEFILESPAVFHIGLPDPITGLCPPGDPSELQPMPVYRLWNQRANHRYMTSVVGRDYMISQGWLSEGYGPNGTAMCTPATGDPCAGCWDY